MYYELIKKKLYIYLVTGIAISILIFSNRVITSYNSVASERLSQLTTISIKKRAIVDDTERIRSLLREANNILPPDATTKSAIFERLDEIKSYRKDIVIKLDRFYQKGPFLLLPVYINFRTSSYQDIVIFLQELNFERFPLFRFRDVTLRKAEYGDQIDKRNLIECNIYGEVFTLTNDE